MRIQKFWCLSLAMLFLLSTLAQGQRRYFRQQAPTGDNLEIGNGDEDQNHFNFGQAPSMQSSSANQSKGASKSSGPGMMTPLETYIDPATYILDVGDLLTLYIWGKSNDEQKLYVASDGKLYLQRGGFIEARGKSIASAEAEIKAIMLRYLIGVNVSLSLTTPRTFLIKVVGEVKYPGIYPAKPIDRLSEIIYQTGGILKTGSQKFVKLLRAGKELHVDLEEFYASAKEGSNPFLQENDTIVVPIKGNRVEIQGEVRKPAVLEIRDKARLLEIIARAGGFTEGLSLIKPIVVSRLIRDKAEREIIEIASTSFENGPANIDFDVLPNDIISVPSSGAWQQTVVVKGAVVGGIAKGVPTESQKLSGGPGEEREGIYPLAGGEKVSDMIKLAGGLTPYADMKAAFISRKDQSKMDSNLETLSIDLYKMYIEKDFSGDIELRAGDILTIPARKFRVFVTGEVRNPTSFDYRSQLTVMEYISMAGGPTSRSDLDDIEVIKADGSEYDFDEVTMLSPGDTIYIPEKLFKFWQDYISISLSITSLLTSVIAVQGALNN